MQDFINFYNSVGWVLTPVKGKECYIKGYNEPAYKGITHISQFHKDTTGVALLHSRSNTCSLDIDNYKVAKETFKKELDIDLDKLCNSVGMVGINNGNKNTYKLIFKRPSQPIRTKKIIRLVKGVKTTIYELKACQDVLPPSIHPDTNQPYVWVGDPNNLPDLPDRLLEHWTQLLTPVIKTPDYSYNTDLKDITEALRFIDPTCDRDSWINIGFALHDFGSHNNQLNEVYNLYNDWSKKSETKYNLNDLNSFWQSCETKASSITINTLFKYAYEGGYVRSLSDMMSQIKQPPKKLTNDFDQIPVPDINLFPKITKDLGNMFQQSVGTDPIVAIYASLATVCGAVNAESRLQVKVNFKVPPILWLMVLGDPSDRKSPASKPIIQVLINIEKEKELKYVQDKAKYRQKFVEYEMKRNNYLAEYKARLKTKAPVSDLLPPSVPKAPHRKILQTGDATSQRLVTICASRPEGILGNFDEMGAFFKKLADVRGTENKNTWVYGYEGYHLSEHRKTQGDTKVDNFAVSIYGNIQPKLFKRYCGVLGEDGFLQRFTPAILNKKYKHRGDENKYDKNLLVVWDEIIRQIHSQDKRDYKLSDEAKLEFIEFEKWLEVREKNEMLLDNSDDYLESLAKSSGLCGRLIFVFHLLENSSDEVPVGLVKRVCILMKSFFIPMGKYLYNVYSSENSLQLKMGKYLLAHSHTTTPISISVLKRSLMRITEYKDARNYEKESLLSDTCNYYAGIGWLIPCQPENPKNENWFINPNLINMQNKQIEAITEAKKSIDDSLEAWR